MFPDIASLFNIFFAFKIFHISVPHSRSHRIFSHNLNARARGYRQSYLIMVWPLLFIGINMEILEYVKGNAIQFISSLRKGSSAVSKYISFTLKISRSLCPTGTTWRGKKSCWRSAQNHIGLFLGKIWKSFFTCFITKKLKDDFMIACIKWAWTEKVDSLNICY